MCEPQHKRRCGCPSVEISPSPLLIALCLGSYDPILDRTKCTTSLKPPLRKGDWVSKVHWFLQRDCDIYSQLGWPLQLLRWSLHLEKDMWEALGSCGSQGTMVASPVILRVMCVVQRFETILLNIIFQG